MRGRKSKGFFDIFMNILCNFSRVRFAEVEWRRYGSKNRSTSD